MIGSLATSPQLPSLTLILTTTDRRTRESLLERPWRRILVGGGSVKRRGQIFPALIIVLDIESPKSQ